MTKIFRLVHTLADIYADSVHVREVGLRDADDSVIWEYAKQHGLTIASKDSDFQQRSLLYGSPPKFIWLRVGNCPVKNRRIAETAFRRYSHLRNRRHKIPSNAALSTEN